MKTPIEIESSFATEVRVEAKHFGLRKSRHLLCWQARASCDLLFDVSSRVLPALWGHGFGSYSCFCSSSIPSSSVRYSAGLSTNVDLIQRRRRRRRQTNNTWRDRAGCGCGCGYGCGCRGGAMTTPNGKTNSNCGSVSAFRGWVAALTNCTACLQSEKTGKVREMPGRGRGKTGKRGRGGTRALSGAVRRRSLRANLRSSVNAFAHPFPSSRTPIHFNCAPCRVSGREIHFMACHLLQTSAETLWDITQMTFHLVPEMVFQSIHRPHKMAENNKNMGSVMPTT